MTIEPSERAREAADALTTECALPWEYRDIFAEAFARFESETLERAAKVADQEVIAIMFDGADQERKALLRDALNAQARRTAAGIRAMKAQG